MLTAEQISENKQDFCELLSKITRPGANITGLLNFLEASDFFVAPASTKFHSSYKGGLCQHSLNVYYNLYTLCTKNDMTTYDKESILICGLLHDLSKVNYYKTTYKNVKKYHEFGAKRDEGGTFDWVSEQSYMIIPEEERFIYGNHEATAEYMVSNYIPLTTEESIAILHHHGEIGNNSQPQASMVYGRYPFAMLLHVADMISTYEDEHNE